MRYWFTLVAACLVGMPGLAHADACDDAGARMVKAGTGIEFVERLEARKAGEAVQITFRHPHAGTIDIFCEAAGQTAITISTATAHPTDELLDLVARAGAAETGVDAVKIAGVLEKCHAGGMAGSTDADVTIDAASLTCTFANDAYLPQSLFEIRKR